MYNDDLIVSDITLSSQVKSCVTDKHNTKYNNTLVSEQPVVNVHISGTKWASSGTRDTVGQFRDDPGHSGTVGKTRQKWLYLLTCNSMFGWIHVFYGLFLDHRNEVRV